MGTMGDEMQVLRTRAEAAKLLESELAEATANTSRLEGLFQVEQARAGLADNTVHYILRFGNSWKLLYSLKAVK